MKKLYSDAKLGIFKHGPPTKVLFMTFPDLVDPDNWILFNTRSISKEEMNGLR